MLKKVDQGAEEGQREQGMGSVDAVVLGARQLEWPPGDHEVRDLVFVEQVGTWMI